MKNMYFLIKTTKEIGDIFCFIGQIQQRKVINKEKF